MYLTPAYKYRGGMFDLGDIYVHIVHKMFVFCRHKPFLLQNNYLFTRTSCDVPFMISKFENRKLQLFTPIITRVSTTNEVYLSPGYY